MPLAKNQRAAPRAPAVGVVAHAVKRDVHHVRPAAHDLLGAVAVVEIDVDDRDLADRCGEAEQRAAR